MTSKIDRVEGRSDVKNGIRRLVLTIIAIGLEIYLIMALFLRLNSLAEWINAATQVLALIIVLGIFSQQKTSAIKTTWIILIIALPVLGVVLYLMIGLNGATYAARRRFEKIDSILLPLLPVNSEVQEDFQKTDQAKASIASYLYNYARYPVWQNTDMVYFDDAAKALEAQKSDLMAAKYFIFMEYHAIEDKESWHAVQSILEQKVRDGVEVRLFYDDMGSIVFINRDFVKRMEALGIRCRVFNRFLPGINFFLNNRDHRKITVIDGRVGYTGGYNLANEYFNIDSPYGYWKDTGVRLEGDAVRNMTVTFLEMWNAVRGDDENDASFDQYLPEISYTASEKSFVLPYADSPMDHEQVGEEVYISMAAVAQRYVWYVTPYLILTDEMIHALGLAAKRGIDVRVITPGIPDKKIIYKVTRSYYNTLTRNGVRIYEYTPGFCHCKMSIADDVIATCGTINMDFRSLYHHFENGCLYYGNKAVSDTKADFEKMFEQSTEVTEQHNSKRHPLLRLEQLILRLFAPLL